MGMSLLIAVISLLPFGECWSKAQPYRGQNQSSPVPRCLPFGAMSSPRTVPDCFNHRALGLSPRSPIWFARVSGYLKRNHRRTALRCPKAKTPQDALWSWFLARTTARRLKVVQKTRLLYDKTTQYPAGFRKQLSAPRCHSRRFGLYMILLSCKPLWSQIF
jgi:hypothetical protein